MEADVQKLQQILCADRVTQMTKTYNDTGALTRLLEEKERDLELAARIGQTLLEKNKAFEEKNEQLEELVAQANEKINQLKHELSMKDELLKIFTQSYEGQEGYSPDGGANLAAISPDLKKKVKSLEDENLELKLETSQLKSVTDILEEKEQKLVNDCVQQLEDVHQQLELFAKELSEKTEECSSHKDEITSLLHQIVALQKKVRLLTAENLDYQKTLDAAHDTENYLSREIAELKEKNEEILILLEDAQGEVRCLRNKERPNAVRHNYLSSSMLSVPSDSLASELEDSLRSEVDYPRGYSPMDRRRHNWKVFETAKAAKGAGHGHSQLGSSLGVPGSSCNVSMLGTSEAESGAESQSVSQRSSMYFSDGESGVSEGYGGEVESVYGACGGANKLGRPGIPGSSDLQTALRRLSMRRANELNEMDYAREERERQSKQRTFSEATDHSEADSYTPGRCRTPDSMMSANSGYMSMTGSSGNPYFRMPEKLRIVKPLEGSVTLRQWQQLATPNLGRIFESRPGVQIKGEKKLDLDPEVYTLSDYEEDDDIPDYTARFQESSGVYTLTNSTVRHPSEADRTSSSFSSSTPRMAISAHGDQQGTSTYSMSLGLASLLNERDLIKTPPEGSQVSSLHTNVRNSNPARFPSLVSDSHYNSASSTTPTSLTMPTNSYNLISSSSTWSQKSERYNSAVGPRIDLRSQNMQGAQGEPADGQRSVGAVSQFGAQGSDTSSSSNNSVSPNSDVNGLAVLNKLKDTGFSLYGYLTGGNNTSEHDSSVSRPDSLPLTSTSGSRSYTLASTTTNTVTMATGEMDVDRLVTAGPAQDTKKMSKIGKLISKHTAGGLIGALAKYHRDGAL